MHIQNSIHVNTVITIYGIKIPTNTIASHPFQEHMFFVATATDCLTHVPSITYAAGSVPPRSVSGRTKCPGRTAPQLVHSSEVRGWSRTAHRGSGRLRSHPEFTQASKARTRSDTKLGGPEKAPHTARSHHVGGQELFATAACKNRHNCVEN